MVAAAEEVGAKVTRPPGGGIRVAVFCRKVHDRGLRPLLATPDQPPAPLELRRALGTIDRIINQYATNARLGTAA